MTSHYCAPCNARWSATHCGACQSREADWHARCPHPCAICGLPITGRAAMDACPGHTRAEHDALMLRLRGRVTP